MKNRALQRQLAMCRFALRDLGLFGWLGAALIAGAIFYAAVVIPERNAELGNLRRQIDQLQAERLTLATGDLSQVEHKTGNPGQATAAMPVVTATPKIMLSLEDMARQDGLDIKRSDYRYVDSATTAAARKAKDADSAKAGEQLLEVHITTPVSGNYQSLRAFLSHALEKLPTLAVDDLTVKRESIANGRIQAQLRFTLFVRSLP